MDLLSDHTQELALAQARTRSHCVLQVSDKVHVITIIHLRRICRVNRRGILLAAPSADLYN